MCPFGGDSCLSVIECLFQTLSQRNRLMMFRTEHQVEAHSPKDWTPEHTKKLRDLVDELGAPFHQSFFCCYFSYSLCFNLSVNSLGTARGQYTKANEPCLRFSELQCSNYIFIFGINR